MNIPTLIPVEPKRYRSQNWATNSRDEAKNRARRVATKDFIQLMPPGWQPGLGRRFGQGSRTDMTDRLSTQIGHLDLGKLDGFR